MRPMKWTPGVVSGATLQELFGYCVDAEGGSHSTNAALRAAKEASSPIVIQLSGQVPRLNYRKKQV